MVGEVSLLITARQVSETREPTKGWGAITGPSGSSGEVYIDQRRKDGTNYETMLTSGMLFKNSLD
jgi:hypothetical protein